MCGTMLYVATQPITYKAKGSQPELTRWQRVAYVLPCYRLVMPSSADSDDTLTSEEVQHLDRSIVGSNHRNSLAVCQGSIDRTPSLSRAHNSHTSLIQLQSAAEFKRPNSHATVSVLVSDKDFTRFRQDDDSGLDPVCISIDDDESRLTSVRAASKNSWTQLSFDCEQFSSKRHTDRNSNVSSKKQCVARCASAPNSPSGDSINLQPQLLQSADDSDILLGFKPPSSIRLRDSIDNELNYSNFCLKTPDRKYSSDCLSLPRSDSASSIGARNRAFSFDASCCEESTNSIYRQPPIGDELKARDPVVTCKW